jgi:hypothetical protein
MQTYCELPLSVHVKRPTFPTTCAYSCVAFDRRRFPKVSVILIGQCAGCLGKGHEAEVWTVEVWSGADTKHLQCDHTLEANIRMWRNMHNTPPASHRSTSWKVVSLVEAWGSFPIQVFACTLVNGPTGSTRSARAV